MVSVPVKRVVLYAQVIPREISRWIAQVVILIPQDTFTEEIITDINKFIKYLRKCVFQDITFKNSDYLARNTFTHCLGGVGMTFACNGSVTVDCRGLPAPSLSTVSEMWPV